MFLLFFFCLIHRFFFLGCCCVFFAGLEPFFWNVCSGCWFDLGF